MCWGEVETGTRCDPAKHGFDEPVLAQQPDDPITFSGYGIG
jgi:hypothetical protein